MKIQPSYCLHWDFMHCADTYIRKFSQRNFLGKMKTLFLYAKHFLCLFVDDFMMTEILSITAWNAYASYKPCDLSHCFTLTFFI